MNQTDSSIEAIHDIRQIMERSSRFLSLSGWNGIAAGFFALVASYFAYDWITEFRVGLGNSVFHFHESLDLLLNLSLLAVAVLVATLAVAAFFTARHARKTNHQVWSPASKRMVINLFIPLVAGGIFIFGMLYNGIWEFVAAACLVFYGLGLINASKYTVTDVRIVGFIEIITGLASLFFPAQGLFFWAFGFGIIHLVYGILMFMKYDMKADRS